MISAAITPSIPVVRCLLLETNDGGWRFAQVIHVGMCHLYFDIKSPEWNTSSYREDPFLLAAGL